MSLVSVWDLDTHFKVRHFSDLHAKDTGLFYAHSLHQENGMTVTILA